MAIPIKIIATHKRAHFDEHLGRWLLQKFGEKEFPAIKDAEVQYWGEQDIKKAPQEYDTEGILLIGIGGGRFDEHTTREKKGKKKECAATLVAKFLGLNEDPLLENLIRFALRTDKNSSNPSDLAWSVQVLNHKWPNDSEKVFNQILPILDEYYEIQKQFFNETREEFEKKAQIEETQIGNKNLKLVSIISDDEQVAKFSRSLHGCEAAVTIQKNSKGNVQIFTNKRFYLFFSDVVVMIRIEEQRAKGKIVVKPKTMSVTEYYDYLSREGIVHEAEEWFFHKEIQALLNGSLTKPDVPPTRLSLDEIQRSVKIGVDNTRFYENCDVRRCRNCPWNKWYLRRCRKLRFETFHSKSNS